MLETDICEHCGQQLRFRIKTEFKFCEAPGCQREKVRFLQKQKQLLKNNLQAQIRVQIVALNAESKNTLDIDRMIVGVVPANTSPIKSLEPNRIELFKQHFKTLFLNQSNNADYPYSNVQYQYKDQQDNDMWLGLACSTCKGYCCRLGDNHAFLDWQSVCDIRSQLDKEYTDAQLLDYYLSFIPKTSYEKGCLFQGDTGCALPCELRSHTCNRYLCKDVKAISATIKARTLNREEFYIAAVNNGEIVRIKNASNE